jgi:prolyl 4-hydroxylase
MKERMDGYRFIPHFLSLSEVESLKERLDAIGWTPAAIRLDSGVKNDTRIRDSDRVEFTDSALADSLWLRVQAAVSKDVLSHMCAASKDPEGLRSWFRGYRYAPGQRFGKHRDAWESCGALVTKITALMYLTDASGGGGATTLHPNRGVDMPAARIEPSAGGLLLFSARILHEGEPPTLGCKMVLRTDVLFAPEKAQAI